MAVFKKNFTSTNDAIEYLVNSIVLITLSISFFLTLFINPYVYHSHYYHDNNYLFAILIYFALFLSISKVVLLRSSNLFITKLDFSLAAMYLAILLSRIGRNFFFWNEIVININVISALYVTLRLTLTKHNLKNFIIIVPASILIQFIYIGLDYVRYFDTPDRFIYLTGTLGNSGLCAGFIVITTPITIYLLQEYCKRILPVVGFIGLVTSILIIMESKAALLAAIPIIHIFYPDSNKLRSKTKPARLFITSLFTVAVLPLIAYTYYLFKVKLNSFSGRLYILNLTIKNLTLSFTGVGFGEFPKIYQEWQIKYFNGANYNTNFAALADLPNNVFNEPLQIYIETGTIGFLALVAIIYFFFKGSRQKENVFSGRLKLSALCLLIFSFFSYPFHSLPTLFLGIIVTASCSSIEAQYCSFKISQILTMITQRVLMLICPWVICYFFSKNSAVNRWNNIKTISCRQWKSKLNEYDKIFITIPENGQFLLDYARFLREINYDEKSVLILKKLDRDIGGVDAILDLGKINENVGNYSIAEKYYLRAHYSCPVKLKPKFFLLLLYLKENDTKNAKSLAYNIVNSKVKVFNYETMHMLDFAEHYLNTNDTSINYSFKNE